MKIFVAYTSTKRAELFAKQEDALDFVLKEQAKAYEEEEREKGGAFEGYYEMATEKDKKNVNKFLVLSWKSLKSKNDGAIPYRAFTGYVLEQEVNE